MEFMPHAERGKFHSMKQVKSESEEYVFIEPILCKVKHRFKTKHGKTPHTFLRILESIISPLHNSLEPSL